ncbi:[Fe-Fe] hydrogenase large subunit C-terminal domain-containing protein, partial [Clostridioides difficile]|uniref:[Fe-Fe] hydrogenase large subunit C-terminal domain-containing protein n=1 Tax=Clostridioides difficile TaxID=1496 RepID=UPI0023504529
GFEDMIEVALAADMLTAKEAYDYYEHMKKDEEGCFITSCCCPTKAGATIAYTGLFISFNNFIIGINSILSEIAPNLHLDTQS